MSPGVAAGRGQDGLTVVELTVVMAVMVLVTAILLGLLDHTTNVYRRASEDVQAENEGRLALRVMTEDVRGASPASIAFTGAVAGACPATPTPATCLRFTIERPTTANPSCRSVVTYGLFDGWVQQTRNDSGCASNTVVSRKLLTGVVNGATPLFSYYDGSGAALTSGQAGASSVKVTLLVTYQGAQQPLTLSSTLSLRNAR